MAMRPRPGHNTATGNGLATLTFRASRNAYGAAACHNYFLEQAMNTKFLIPLCAAALLAACGQRDNSQATGSDAADAPGSTAGQTGGVDDTTSDSAGAAGATPGATTSPDTATTPDTTAPGGTTPDTTSAPDDNTPSTNQPTTSPGG